MTPQAYPASPDYQPGTWHSDVWLAFTCPNGHTGSLASHDIAADGTVTPSVVCPHDGCPFHAWIRLAGWSAGEVFAQEDSE